MAVAVWAQSDPVLMRINGEEILRSEFEYAYRRHSQETSERLLPQEYVPLFIQTKQQAQVARAAGIDTTADFCQYKAEERAKWGERSIMGSEVAAEATVEQVEVMQVFRYLPQRAPLEQIEAASAQMDSLYRVIGEQPQTDFSYWVEHFSDDRQRQWIGRLQRVSEFEDTAFSLAVGEVAPPFFSPEGIHIIKVVGRRVLPDSVRQSSSRAIQPVVERLKEECLYKPDADGMNELLTRGTTRRTLFTIGEHAYTGELFEQFAASCPLSVERQLEGFITKSLLDYEYANMERKYPEVRRALQVSEESRLAKEIIRREVDLPAARDSSEWASYFAAHRSDYRWEMPHYKGIVVHCMDKSTAKRVKKILKKTPEEEWVPVLRSTFSIGGTERVQTEQGVFCIGENPYVDKLVFKQGSYTPVVSYPFTIVVGRVQKIPDDYHQVADRVRSDYRNHLYTRWMESLQAKSKVEINQEVLKTVNAN